MVSKLIIADSEHDSNMFYAAGILIPDDFVYLEKNGKKTIYVSDLEFNRAKKEARVDNVINFSRYGKGINRNTFSGILNIILKENKIKKVLVPENFKMKYAEILTKNKIKIEVKQGIFFGSRMVKNSAEINKIAAVQKVNEKAMSAAIAVIKKSKIGKDGMLEFQGKFLTSEFIKEIIHLEFLKGGCFTEHSVVSCGNETADPHCYGKGLLFANQPIIIDIFPRSSQNRYFSDMTRTVVKGKASLEIKKIFQAVLKAQKIAISKIKPGIKTSSVHKAAQDYFNQQGFATQEKDGNVEGFIHGTGHGVGLDIHEAPSLSAGDETILKPGNIVTVEPGLYYPGIGGVRIEDLVAVTKNGCENLTNFPKVLEI